MPSRQTKRQTPKDINELAFHIVQETTKECPSKSPAGESTIPLSQKSQQGQKS